MNKKVKIICIGLCILIISYGYYFLNLKFNFSVDCIFHKITGLYCPGCGITRMFFSLIHLEVYQALRYNPLVFILFIGYILYLLIDLLSIKFFNKKIKINQKFTYFILIIVIIYGIIRNIPFFDFLRPTKII